MSELAGACLQGKTVVVTRSPADALPLTQRLQALGAHVVLLPSFTIEPIWPLTEPILAALRMLPHLACWGFASQHAVQMLAHLLQKQQINWPHTARLVAIGPGTAHSLQRLGHTVSAMADVATAEGLAAALMQQAANQTAGIFLPGSAIGRTVTRDILQARGYRVQAVAIYHTRIATAADPKVVLPSQVDYVVFTSPSAVRGFLARTQVPQGAKLISLGPTTSLAIQEQGLVVYRQAQTHTLEGLLHVFTSGL